MTGRTPASGRRTLLIANPSSDVYGSDLQMLETISAVVEAGWRVVVTTPDDGPLIALAQARGAEVERLAYPVLRRADATPRGILRLLGPLARGVVGIVAILRRVRPDVVYVNTVTLPWWSLVTRVMSVPAVCHVHEVELGGRRLIRLGLMGPLVLARRVIMNSDVALQAACADVPGLRARSSIVHNGVREPTGAVAASGPHGEPYRLCVVGRLTPRKGTDIALEAVALLREQGRAVELDVYGSAFTGMEWYVEQLEERAARPDLAGAVTFRGYVDPMWSALQDTDVVLAPSLHESFGNAVVEAQLAMRPVVAAATTGHLETVQDGRTGVLVPPGDPAAMAVATARLLDHPDEAAELGEHGRAEALRRFSLSRYRQEIADLLGSMARR